MKKILLLLLLSSIVFSASNFRVGVNTLNMQDAEGTGFSLAYHFNEKWSVETAYNAVYLRAITKGTTKEAWKEFATQRLGIRYHLSEHAHNTIKTFLSLGGEYVYKNTKLSTEDAKFNTYFLLGVDFSIGYNFDITFAMGSSGKGVVADKMEGEPNYAHGFNSIVGIEYNF